MFGNRLSIPGSKVNVGLETEELDNRETNEDYVIIVPKMSKDINPLLYVITIKPLHS